MIAAEKSDTEVVRAVLDGRRDDYSVLVRRYQDVLFAHAYRLVQAHDEAADLVQRAFVQGFKRLRTCREPAKVGAWLFRILSNLCRDHLRSRRRSDLSLEVLPGIRSGDETPEGEAHRSELRGHLRRALDEIDPEHKEAFVLKHVDGRSYQEMSALLGVSVPALKMRVHRARDGLRELLEVYR